jgi:hypothetical protein
VYLYTLYACAQPRDALTSSASVTTKVQGLGISFRKKYESAGTEHPSTLTSTNNLAGVLSDLGKCEQAVEMHQSVSTQVNGDGNWVLKGHSFTQTRVYSQHISYYSLLVLVLVYLQVDCDVQASSTVLMSTTSPGSLSPRLIFGSASSGAICTLSGRHHPWPHRMVSSMQVSVLLADGFSCVGVV